MPIINEINEIIRPLAAADHQAVLDIYNHYVLTTPFTFDTEPFTLAARKDWFDSFAAYPCLVACEEGKHEDGGKILGYACAGVFRRRPAYRTSAEVAIYLAPDDNILGKGLGARLYSKLFDSLGTSYHRAYARIVQPNPASVALHRKCGFQQVGLMSEVGYKFNRFWDVAWYEKKMA